MTVGLNGSSCENGRQASSLVTSVKVVYENVIGLANYAAFFLPSARCSGTFSRFSMVM